MSYINCNPIYHMIFGINKLKLTIYFKFIISQNSENHRDNPGVGHCQIIRKLCKIEEIRLQIWKDPLYNLSKYAISFGLGPQIRVHRPLLFPLFANGPSFLPILYTF